MVFQRFPHGRQVAKIPFQRPPSSSSWQRLTICSNSNPRWDLTCLLLALDKNNNLRAGERLTCTPLGPQQTLGEQEISTATLLTCHYSMSTVQGSMKQIIQCRTINMFRHHKNHCKRAFALFSSKI